METNRNKVLHSKDASLARVVDEDELNLLEHFRKLVEDEVNLSCPMDDAYLLKFLRKKKMDPEEAFKDLKNWWKIRHKMACHHDGLYPSVYEELYKQGFAKVLAHRDRHGRQIVLWRVGCWNPKETIFAEMFKSNFPILDTISLRQETQLNGTIFIVDYSGLSASHVQACGPSAMKLLWYLTDGFPMRIKGIHFVNNPSIFNAIYTCAKVFMKEKIKKRVHFHGHDFSSLHEYVEREILPTCYGGVLSEEEFQEPGFIKLILSREQFFYDLFNNYGYKQEKS